MQASRYGLDDFELYKLAREFRRKTYRLIRQLPQAERNCLAPQMQRAAVSVTNNIAEGHGRWHYQENIHYCRMSRGSVSELIDDFNVCEDEDFGQSELRDELKQDALALVARINGYIAYLRKCKQGDSSP